MAVFSTEGLKRVCPTPSQFDPHCVDREPAASIGTRRPRARSADWRLSPERCWSPLHSWIVLVFERHPSDETSVVDLRTFVRLIATNIEIAPARARPLCHGNG